ncbi:MAG: flavodoxin-dependent (E)-4-hydroxy-3-methylbut-2-enyl-diphosphate synthase [Bacillota bacterium]|nr:flavodoxin-dependent (E)-4-hydroxy-3-methylbut-2-enyl-diphosphate synthase [Bacillota bacterium]
MSRNKKQVLCGGVAIGGNAPVTIQSMTNTPTADVGRTVEQIRRLTDAGCEIIRAAVPDMEAAAALKEIRRQCSIPLVADIHFDYRLALAAMEAGADKIRINPGNIGGEENVRLVVEKAKKCRIPIRVGVNSGSLEKHILRRDGKVTAKGLAESVLYNVALLEKYDFEDIVISLKSSSVRMNNEAYRIVDRQSPYPLHIGVTEAGTPSRGKVKSAAGIGALLLDDIGDTLRVSLTADPVEEVVFARQLLAALDIRREGIEIVSCPTCGRTQVDLERIIAAIEEKLAPVKTHREKRGSRPLKLAVMGCAVNGPGEARGADIGVACGKGRGVLFAGGEIVGQTEEANIPAAIFRMIEEREQE